MTMSMLFKVCTLPHYHYNIFCISQLLGDSWNNRCVRTDLAPCLHLFQRIHLTKLNYIHLKLDIHPYSGHKVWVNTFLFLTTIFV